MSKLRILGLAALLSASACGGGGFDASISGPLPASSAPSGSASPSSSPAATDSPPAASPEAAQRIDPREGGLQVGFGEWAVTPEADAIRPGRVTFVVNNGGTLVHGFELKSEDEGSGSNSGPGGGDESDDEFKVESNTFGPGQTIRIDVDLPPGLYELECFVADHDELGMRTLLEVREGAPLVAPEVAASDQVVVQGFAFGPATLEVPAQTEVTWINRDTTQHTVTARDQSFDSGILEGGARFSARFDAPGEFAYFCQIHPDMEGIIRVTG